MVQVKICGMTRVADAALACELGATAVGVVLWEGSPRCTDRATARAIVQSLPPTVTPVGVFVDPSISQVEEAVTRIGLRTVQMHGNETISWCQELSARLGVGVMKAVSLRGTASVEVAVAVPDSMMVLLDAHDPVKKGGTGQPIDWSLAAEVARRRQVYLAGGLTPGNIVEAIRSVRPYGVDVSSGLEAAPGVKDAGLMRDFFTAVALAENRHERVGEGETA